MKDGAVLFLIETIVAITVCLITKRKGEKGANHLPSSPITFSFASAIRDGVYSTLTVCGFVIYFSCILSLVKAHFPTSVYMFSALLLEVSHGCEVVASHPLGFPLTAFAVCFSGISVHLQTAALCRDLDLSLAPYLLWKLFSGAFASLLAFFYIFLS
jgi:hypothetical protein